MARSATTPLSLRPPRPADLPQLLALEQAAFTTDRLSARRFQHWMRADNCHFEVASTPQEEVAGYTLVLYRRNSSRARLYSIVVAPAHRGNGLAQRLLERSEMAARRRGCSTFCLEVRPDNHSAVRLYEKNGYQYRSRITGFYEDGTDALRLEKHLR